MTIESTIIQELINAILVIIPLGGAARIIFCGVSMMQNDEKRPEMKRRIINVLLFIVFAEAAAGIIDIVYHYFG